MKILVPIDGERIQQEFIDFVTSRATLLGHNANRRTSQRQAAVPSRASNLDLVPVH